MKSSVSYAVRILVLAMACFGTTVLGHVLALHDVGFAPFWPPAGLVVAVFLLGGFRYWPGLALGLVLGSLFEGEPLGLSMAYVAAEILGGMTGALLFQRFRRDIRLERVTDVLGFVAFGAIAGPAIGATFGALALKLSHGAALPLTGSAWGSWWMGNALGALLVGPVVLTWARREGAPERRSWLELAGFLVVVTALVGSLFFATPFSLPFLLFIPTLWAALRFGVRGTSLSTLIMMSAVIGLTAHGRGIIASRPNALVVLLTFVAVSAITGLVLSAVTAERAHAEARRLRDSGMQRAVVAASPLGIVALDPLGRVTAWNSAAESIFGFTGPEVLGTIPPIVPEHHLDSSGFHQAALAGGAFTAVPVVRRRKDGSVVQLNLSSAPLRDEEGRISGVVEIFADPTERQRSDESIRRSEARLKLVLEQALDAIITIDESGRVTGWNPQAELIFGWSAPEVMGRQLSHTIIPARLREAHEVGIQRFRATGESKVQGRRLEMPGLHRAGHEFPIELTIGSVRLGQEVIFTAFVRDITERKRAENALRASEDRYRAFITQSTEAIWCFELDHPMPVDLTEDEQIEFLYQHGVLSDCNDEMARMYGLSQASDLIGLRTADLLVRSDPKNREYLVAFLRSGYRITDAESHELDRDGRNKYFLNNLIGILEAGALVRAWGTQRDITERKSTEGRSEAFASLAHQLSGAKAPVEAARIIVDVAHDLCGWEACSLDLYSAEQDRIDAVLTVDLLDGKSVEIPPAYTGGPPSAIGRQVIVQGPQLILRDSEDAETDGLTMFGNTARRSASLMFVPIRNQTTVIGVLSIQSYRAGAYTGKDLSLLQALADQCGAALERIRAEQELHRAEEQLRQAMKMEAVGRLAGGIAHDFNNLLTTILGTSDLLLEELPETGRWREDVQEIRKAGHRAAELTRQLLAFSRKQVIDAETLDLNETVTGVVKMLGRLIGEDIELITKLAPDLGLIKADPGQMEQVVMNLAVNSRDALPEGGKLIIETANVDFAGDAVGFPGLAPGKYVMLAVSDDGTGMDAETRSHIFEPFFTTKELGKGTGLGLATVYAIVRQSAGQVMVYSEPGAGAVFKIYLPLATEEKPPHRISAQQPVKRGWETVLVTEDEPAVRALAKRVLESQGYSVIAVGSGDAALEAARAHRGEIHLLLTDVVMPGMSGPQVAERLLLERPGIKVLFMSGYTDTAITHHGVLEPGIWYLQKPFSPRSLGEKVRQVLDASPNNTSVSSSTTT